MSQAVTELARVRRLQLPQILVSVTQPPASPPQPRRAAAEVITETLTDETSKAGKATEARRLPGKGASRGKRGNGVKGSGRKAA
jgi:hypothetical protein